MPDYTKHIYNWYIKSNINVKNCTKNSRNCIFIAKHFLQCIFGIPLKTVKNEKHAFC